MCRRCMVRTIRKMNTRGSRLILVVAGRQQSEAPDTCLKDSCSIHSRAWMVHKRNLLFACFPSPLTGGALEMLLLFFTISSLLFFWLSFYAWLFSPLTMFSVSGIIHVWMLFSIIFFFSSRLSRTRLLLCLLFSYSQFMRIFFLLNFFFAMKKMRTFYRFSTGNLFLGNHSTSFHNFHGRFEELYCLANEECLNIAQC